MTIGQLQTNSNLFNCEGCVKQISRLADSCPHCGHPVRKDENGNIITTPQLMIDQKIESESNGYGIACFVFALCSFIPMIGFIAWILSLIFGCISLSKENSKGLAAAGLIILIFPVILLLAVIF